MDTYPISPSWHLTLNRLVRLEPFVLVMIALGYWFPTPERERWLWLIVLWLPILAARWVTERRLWTITPFDELFVALLALFVVNIYTAPFETRGFILIFRPMFGVILVWACVESARRAQALAPLLRAVTLFALLVGMAALLASDWSGKSAWVLDLTAPLPNLRNFWVWEGGFNTNEIAGAMTWLTPLMLALALKQRRVVAALAAFTLMTALIFGQSLSALAGVSVGGIIALAPRRWSTRLAAGAAIGLAIGYAAVIAAPNAVIDLLKVASPRQEVNSLNHRVELWQSARAIITDYPLTGAGIAMYRQPLVRYLYPTPNYAPTQAVHAHNALLNIGADVGLPGMIIYGAIFVTAGGMLARTWRRAPQMSTVTGGLVGGLIAHAAYGLADAIPVWDRFAFVGWWWLGLIAAHYLLSVQLQRNADSST